VSIIELIFLDLRGNSPDVYN